LSHSIEKGRISNAHFSSYRCPRFKDVPEIEAILLAEGHSSPGRKNADHGHRPVDRKTLSMTPQKFA